MSHNPLLADSASTTPPCPTCQSTYVIKKGQRKNKLEVCQLWFCKLCPKTFTAKITKHKTYPIKAIVEGLSLYNKGYSLAETCLLLKKYSALPIHPSTLSAWLKEFASLTPYQRLRTAGATIYEPKNIIKTVRLQHKQIYAYRVHLAKLELLLGHKQTAHLAPIRDYLLEMLVDCPHSLFLESQRASSKAIHFDIDQVEIRALETRASEMTAFVLQTVTDNHQRHEAVQKFMTFNDSATVAVEVPIVLYPEDIAHLQNALGFNVPLSIPSVLTGHIDVLQIRNGQIHILDYKPNATKEKPIGQLMSYALAISRRTGLRLFDITCAWFDEKDYFEFYPLHVIHKRR
jgi:transposase-like protein